MIGTSLPEYVFILTSIALLRLVAPISFIYVAYLIAAQPTTTGRWQASLGGYAVLEVFFYTLVYLPRGFLLQKAWIIYILSRHDVSNCSSSLQRTPPFLALANIGGCFFNDVPVIWQPRITSLGGSFQ